MKQAIFSDTLNSGEEMVEGLNKYFQQKIPIIRENFETPEQDNIYPNISCKYHIDSFTSLSQTDATELIRKSSNVFFNWTLA